MNEIKDYIDQIAVAVKTLGPEALTIVLCVAGGYIGKVAPVLNNKLIPVIVIAAGMVAYPLISSPGDQPHEMRSPIVRQVIIGLILALGAWALHQAVLRKLIDDKLWPPVAEKEKPLGP